MDKIAEYLFTNLFYEDEVPVELHPHKTMSGHGMFLVSTGIV